ncbi:MAG: hypothetical protein V4726_21920 [Verrucomicrobiota bacterium]
MRAHPADFSCPAVTRRSVLAWTGTGFSAVVIGILNGSSGGAGAAAAPPDPAAAGSQALHREAFAPYLGEEFILETENGPRVSCRLTEITDEKYSGMVPERFVTFSLLFSGASNLPEGRIYQVSHSRMSARKLFLSPVGAAGKNRLLEAVLSLKTDT